MSEFGQSKELTKYVERILSPCEFLRRSNIRYISAYVKKSCSTILSSLLRQCRSSSSRTYSVKICFYVVLSTTRVGRILNVVAKPDTDDHEERNLARSGDTVLDQLIERGMKAWRRLTQFEILEGNAGKYLRPSQVSKHKFCCIS